MRLLEIVTGRGRGRARAVGGLGAAALLVTASACVSLGDGVRSSDPFATASADRDEIVIEVRNFNFNDATVWTIRREGRDQKLGIVTGKSDKTFRIRWEVPQPLRLEFDLLASVRCVTDELTVDPGDILQLQISADPTYDPMCR